MTHAERKSDCKYEVEREGRKRKRMRVRNEGENRLKKPTLKQQKSLLILQKKLPAAQENLSVTHSHTCSSFFLCRLILPFLLSRDLQSSAAAMVCVCRVLAVCVCVCVYPRVGKRCVESNVSRLIHPDVAFCRLSLLVIWAENWSLLGLCLFVEVCVCAHVCLCVCFSSLISVYFQSLSQLSQLLSVFLSFLCLYVYQMLFGHKQWRLRGLHEDMCPTHLPPWEEK